MRAQLFCAAHFARKNVGKCAVTGDLDGNYQPLWLNPAGSGIRPPRWSDNWLLKSSTVPYRQRLPSYFLYLLVYSLGLKIYCFIKFFSTQITPASSKELVLSCLAHSSLSYLCCSGHSLLLNSDVSIIGRIENPSCSACSHQTQDTSHLILFCPAMDFLRRMLFGYCFLYYSPQVHVI